MNKLSIKKIVFPVVLIGFMFNLNAEQGYHVRGENCTRIFFFAHDNKNFEYRSLLQKAKSFSVLRKIKNQSSFQQIYSIDLPSSETDFKAFLEDDKKKLTQKTTIEPGVAVQKFQSELEILIKKQPAAFMLSIYNPKLSQALGQGYLDCEIDKTSIYSYYFKYTLENGQKIKYPQEPVSLEYKKIVFPEFKISQIDSEETGAIIKYGKSSGPDGVAIGANIYRREEGAGRFEKVNEYLVVPGKGFSALKYNDRSLEAEKNYEYGIRPVAFNFDEGPMSNIIQFKLKDLSMVPIVQNVRVQAIDVGLQVTWTNPKHEKVIGYNIFRAIGGNEKIKAKAQNPFEKINKVVVPANKTEFIDISEKKPGYRYVYRVTAVNSAGNESAMSSAGFLDYADLSKPETVRNVRVQSLKEGVLIEWEYLNDENLQGFMLYRNSTSAEPSQPLTNLLKINERKYLDTDAKAYAGYWYSLRVASKNGILSDYSAPVHVVVIDYKPVMAVPSLSIKKINNDFFLNWSKPNEERLAGYFIDRIEGNQKIRLTAEPLNKNTFTFIDKGRAGDDTSNATYEIRAVSTSGEVSEITSVTFSRNKKIVIKNFSVTHTQIGEEILFSWNPSVAQENYEVVLLRKKNNEVNYRVISTSKAVTLKITDKPQKGEIYQYSLAKIDKKSREITEKSKVIQLIIN